jgi:hypothetical protein
MTPVRERDTLVKRLIVVLAMAVGFLVVSPTEPASAATPHCGGAYIFADPVRQPAGSVSIPTQYFGNLGGVGTGCVMNIDQTPIGWGVVALQQSLKNCYGQSIVVDGDFGPATKAALRNAQRIHRIPDDGQYGPQTRDTLLWWTDQWDGPYACFKFRQ